MVSRRVYEGTARKRRNALLAAFEKSRNCAKVAREAKPPISRQRCWVLIQQATQERDGKR